MSVPGAGEQIYHAVATWEEVRMRRTVSAVRNSAWAIAKSVTSTATVS